ncbi:hypothetical protein AG0111_0g9552 [Alternaria gaisen]|uniref:Uncharacterized protein n=1 Tax=Alternaria gaisen TaxID=167740 RepID=A0ACB6FBU5_9PLEO|nr:hypothetical protein AG0111_0g9552 [Alternaria gaisen]
MTNTNPSPIVVAKSEFFQGMEKEHRRSGDDNSGPSNDGVRPSKRIKLEETQSRSLVESAYSSTLEQHNRLVNGSIYTDRLEAQSARFLVLHPGSLHDKIECHLIRPEDFAQTHSDETFSYEALSYVWGEEKDPEFIVLCKSRFAITQNLAQALKYLRYTDRVRVLWIDAICINQCDGKEKEAQLLSMHRVYQFAKEVIAWLGLPDKFSRLAFSTMTMTERRKRHGWSNASAEVRVDISEGRAVTEDDAFEMLMKRPYWSRAWIVQEMMSAQSLVIQCGSDAVLYSTLEETHPHHKPACIQISSAENPSGLVKFQGDSEVTILQMGSKRICSKRYLDCFLDRQCRLRHDNIFAFLNLLSDDIQERVKVSYQVDLRKLILDTAKAIIESTQSLHIIGIKGRQTPPSALGEDGWQLDMPSWCPYLATPYECRPLEPRSKPNLFEERGVFSFVNSMLQVRGFVIGRVSKTILRQTPPEVRAKAWWDEADIKRERKYYWKCPSRLLLALSLPVEATNFILKHCGETKKAIWTWQKLFSYVRFGITDRPGPYVRSHSVAQRLEHFTPAKMRQLGG